MILKYLQVMSAIRHTNNRAIRTDKKFLLPLPLNP